MGLALVAAFAPVRSLAGDEPSEAVTKMVTKEYDFRNFDAIDASWVYRIELTQATRYSVRVEAPEFVAQYLRVEQAGDRLRLGIKSLPANVQRKMNHEEVFVYISMPDLSGLQLSGAAKLRAKGTFRNKKSNFKMDLSGAVNLTGLQVLSQNAAIDCSGAVKYDFAGDFDTVDMDFSGAVDATMHVTGKEVFLDMSGATKLDLETNAGTAVVGLSGAANLTLTGKADQLKAEGSGASKFYAERIPVKNVQVNLSGASMIRVNALKTLEVELSGSAHCLYRENPGLSIGRTNVSRGASLSAL